MSNGVHRDGEDAADRPDVSAATAVLIAKNRIDSDVAFEIIAIMASEMDRSVSAVATEIVEQSQGLQDL